MALRVASRFAVLAALLFATACAGVIDDCTKGLEPPPDGWSHP